MLRTCIGRDSIPESRRNQDSYKSSRSRTENLAAMSETTSSSANHDTRNNKQKKPLKTNQVAPISLKNIMLTCQTSLLLY